MAEDMLTADGNLSARKKRMALFLQTVRTACGNGHQQALDTFCLEVLEAWCALGEKWPACEGKIHKEIRKIFDKLCKDLGEASLGQQKEGHCAEVLLVPAV